MAHGLHQISSDRVSPQYVVPEGKIWKLEYAYVNQASNSFLRVNGFIASNLGNAHFPIWLKAGDTIDLYASSFPINNYKSLTQRTENPLYFSQPKPIPFLQLQISFERLSSV